AEATSTTTRTEEFEARFFHAAYEEEFGRVKGHFGPINCVAFHPDGKSYSSGGEDGYVRIHYSLERLKTKEKNERAAISD
uniref:Serine-threonine kinase receptor-associated protein n=1 Tax=Amphiprion percula TaxID=161767 RepID=A0A3P8SV70_AMPPE